MRPSNRAMIWYFWRLSRRNLLLLLVLSTGVALFLAGPGFVSPEVYCAQVNLTVQVFLIAAIGGCLFMGFGEKSFLPHQALLTLPLATSRYLRLLYAYVMAAIAGIALLATAVHIHFFGDHLQRVGPDFVIAYWHLPALCIALVCLVQSMFHLAGIKNELRVIPMAIAMEVLAFRCALPVMDLGGWNSRPFATTVCVSILFAWASSYNSLTTYRNGSQRGGITALLERLDLGRGRRRTFSSPNSALFWLGWRRYGRIFPLWALSLYLIGLVVMAGGALIHPSFRLSSSSSDITAVLYLTTTPMACGAAFLCHLLLLMRSHEDLFGTGRGFFLTLPVRSAGLVRGRVLATVVSVLLVVVAGTALLLLAASLSSEFHLAVTWRYFTLVVLVTLALWLTLWFGLAIVTGYLAILPIMLGTTILGMQSGGEPIVMALAVAGVAASAYCLLRGVRLGLLKGVDLCLFAAACLAALAAVSIFFNKSSVMEARYFWVALVYTCALLPVALPFIGAPLLMNWIRHR